VVSCLFCNLAVGAGANANCTADVAVMVLTLQAIMPAEKVRISIVAKRIIRRHFAKLWYHNQFENSSNPGRAMEDLVLFHNLNSEK
jgi:hypothetical protein